MAEIIEDMGILTRGEKAIKDFTPLPFEIVDNKRLRETTKTTRDRIILGLKQMIVKYEKNYG